MKMVDTTVERNVEDNVSDIMDDLFEAKAKLRSTRNFVVEKFAIYMSNLNIEEV